MDCQDEMELMRQYYVQKYVTKMKKQCPEFDIDNNADQELIKALCELAMQRNGKTGFSEYELVMAELFS